jgi:hypothetical protein
VLPWRRSRSCGSPAARGGWRVGPAPPGHHTGAACSTAYGTADPRGGSPPKAWGLPLPRCAWGTSHTIRQQLARHVLAAEGRGAPLRPPLAPPLRAAKGAPPSALSPTPPGELQGWGQLRSPHVTEDHGGLPPIPPHACRPSQSGGHRYPEVITAGGSKTGARLAPLSHVAPVVVCEGPVPQPQFPARQSLVTRGAGWSGCTWGVGWAACFYASCPKNRLPLTCKIY